MTGVTVMPCSMIDIRQISPTNAHSLSPPSNGAAFNP